MKTFNYNGIEVPRYIEGEYYKADNSNVSYRFYGTLHHDKKYYKILCYDENKNYVDIGFFYSSGLRETRYAIHRLITAGPDQKLIFSKRETNKLVDTNSAMWQAQEEWSNR